MTSIYDYRNYSDFLRDKLKQFKKERRKLTCQAIADKLGLKSAGHVSQIINGKTPLTNKQLPGFMDIFEIPAKEREYFTLLVRYSQTGPIDEKRQILKKLNAKPRRTGAKISRDQYAFYEKWYYAAIRDILDIQPFDGSYKELAQLVEPSISTQEARQAIQVLERLGMIYRESDGVYYSASQIIEADFEDDTRIILSGYAQEMIQRAEYALNRINPERRNISWASFSISDEGYKLISDEIDIFRKRILDIVEKDRDSSRVYHLNIHCFPLSKEVKGDKK